MTPTKIYVRIKQHFPDRSLEWLCSLMILATGLIMLLLPGSFERDQLTNFTQILSPTVWTIFCLSVGLGGLIALIINGKAPRISAPLRAIRAIAGTTFFGVFVGRFIDSATLDSIAFSVVAYVGYTIVELYNVKKTAKDTWNAYRRNY